MISEEGRGLCCMQADKINAIMFLLENNSAHSTQATRERTCHPARRRPAASASPKKDNVPAFLGNAAKNAERHTATVPTISVTKTEDSHVLFASHYVRFIKTTVV
jgi:hypothetical protein